MSTPYLLLFISLLVSPNWSLHVTGSFDTNDFFKFVARFGIQATDVHNREATRGYIYGNISVEWSSEALRYDKELIMLTVIDYNYFIDYYNKRRILPRSAACPLMFEKISKVAYFFECSENNTQDFIRRVPCPLGGLCLDEEAPKIVENSQFAFKIQDLNQPRLD